MPFIEQEASSEYVEIDGKKVHYIKPEVEVTLTNMETGQEYMSDKVYKTSQNWLNFRSCEKSGSNRELSRKYFCEKIS